MRGAVLLFLALLSNALLAQPKYDAHWVFGGGGYSAFQGAPAPLYPQGYNLEACGAISDSAGDLLFYVSFQGSGINYNAVLRKADNTVIGGADSLINIHFSATNGLLIIPDGDTLFHLFHVGQSNNSSLCASFGERCKQLYYSTIRLENDSLFYVVKDQLLLPNTLVAEQVVATRHSNGMDWWVICHKNKDRGPLCQNVYYRLLLSNGGIAAIDSQSIGPLYCQNTSVFGEMTFSPDGRNLAVVSGGESRIVSFRFDRCTGELSHTVIVDSALANPYGLAYSPNRKFLYATTLNVPSGDNALYQYNLITGEKHLLWTSFTSALLMGQLELMPDGRILVAAAHSSTGNINSFDSTFYSANLGVINDPDEPDTLCHFQPHSYQLDGGFTMLGLPNYPNYDLGEEQQFLVEAGADTLICATTGSALLGAPPADHVVYQWTPGSTLSDSTVAQPVATPATDTWYYLTATDNLASSCKAVAMDSVRVTVTICTGVQEHEPVLLRLYPNPAVGTVGIYFSAEGNLKLSFYDLLGGCIYTSDISGGQQQVDIGAWPAGIYLYNAVGPGAQSFTGWLVVQ